MDYSYAAIKKALELLPRPEPERRRVIVCTHEMLTQMVSKFESGTGGLCGIPVYSRTTQEECDSLAKLLSIQGYHVFLLGRESAEEAVAAWLCELREAIDHTGA